MSSHRVSRRSPRTAAALTLGLGTALALPLVLAPAAGAAASRATAAVDDAGREVLYTAAAGQTNKVTVTETKSSGLTHLTYVIDDVVPIDAGTGCTHPDGADLTVVSCTVPTLDTQDPYSTLTMALADGDDSATVNNTTGQAYYSNAIHLGAGKDRLTNTGTVDGSTVWGDAGDDTLTVGPASFVFAGDGNDTVHTTGDIVEGGLGNDVVQGSDGTQILRGDDGNDTLYGGRGDDLLYGGAGHDSLWGNSGFDQLWGNSGNDKLYGGPDRDTLSGGPGTDVERQD
ncbi:calcium-binding protein [Streptomyces sp. NBC_01304]|uniref:calcium-binding protein n=1 Tax=Streptomyces sp. NBC_01304 TaxID=2903818 RepID=UPI002E122DCC|nr:calcium-binding protein [Streptomyces sp. NBC_01304]